MHWMRHLFLLLSRAPARSVFRLTPPKKASAIQGGEHAAVCKGNVAIVKLPS